MTELVTKSRNLSLTDFYSILQLEYISYFIRSKIYPQEYAQKYVDYCVCKKEKIEKIGTKNDLPSIFNSTNIKEKYLDKFFSVYGLPNFEYRDDNSLRIMGHWDTVYWFTEGTSVKIRVDGNMILTTVERNLVNSNSVVVIIEGEHKTFRYEYVSRIISDNLTNF